LEYYLGVAKADDEELGEDDEDEDDEDDDESDDEDQRPKKG